MRAPDSDLRSRARRLAPRLVRRFKGARGRAAGLALALVAEAFLALLLLTLGRGTRPGSDRPDAPVTFALAPSEPAADPAPEPAAEPERAAERAAPAPRPPREPAAADAPAPVPPAPVPLPPLPPAPAAPAFIPVPPGQSAALDAPRPRALPKGVAGPPDTGSPFRDTPRVAGTGPNGEPLYAAAWYREPYPEELRGYLSTASGPGWALIACRTVRDWRVEDCVGQDEYPANAGILRAVLAAAWQFKVRPPMIGGRYKVGEWVRIRIDYTRG